MGLINEIFSKPKNEEGCIKNAALINPWYFKKSSPLLIKDSIKLNWKEKEKGISILKNKNKVLGMFKMFACIFPNKDNSKFIVWNRVVSTDTGYPTITLYLHNTSELEKITNPNKEFINFKKNNDKFYLLGTKPVSEFTFKLDEKNNNKKLNLPEEFNDFEEILIVVDIPNLYLNSLPKWNNTALIIINPKAKTANLYPQDWFNKSNANFCYQWLTTACRDSKTNMVRTYGRKIESFLLSENYRDLSKPEDIKKI